MQALEIIYRVTPDDFKSAWYYIYFRGKRIGLYASVGALIAFAVYYILVLLDLVSFNIYTPYVASAFLFWLLWQVNKVNRQVRLYKNQKQTVLGIRSIARFNYQRMSVKIPERAFNFSAAVEDLPCVFENKKAFLLYADSQNLFILPKHCMEEKQILTLRTILARGVKERFISRYKADILPAPAEAAAETPAKEDAKA